MLGLGQRCLDFLQGQLELIGIELLGTASEAVALQGLDDRLQAFDLSLENLECIKLAGLLEDPLRKSTGRVATITRAPAPGPIIVPS